MDKTSDYYDRKQREATALHNFLIDARKSDAPPSVIQVIERALEQARYVGD